jgi:hypothetical protein
VGFGMSGQSTGIAALLQGLVVLALAVFAWPVIARFFTFATIQAASSGLSTALGLALGASAGRGGGSGTAGVRPDMFSQSMEDRIMASRGGAASGGPGSGGGLGGEGAGAGAADGAGGGAGGAGAVLAGIGLALRTAQQAGNAMAARMEQTAAHAGMHGAYPYSTVAGTPRYGALQRPSGRPGQYGGQAGDEAYGEGDGMPEPAAGSSFPDEPAAPAGFASDAAGGGDDDPPGWPQQ